MDIAQKTIVITGAARGLGAAMVEFLAARGARLALIDLDLERLDNSMALADAHGAECRAYAANVAVEDDVVSVYAKIAAEFGALDVSIANAGILRDGLLVKAKDGHVSDKLSLNDWQAVIDVNLTGVFLCGREAAARMIEFGNGGCIINISSISRYGNFGQTNYSAAKAGVAALTATWAKELARFSIRVNAIAPGFVATEILRSMKPEVLAKISATIPCGRLGTPEEVADAVGFVASSEYINGRIIEIDVGLRI
jgi:3-oxoacyl-[acyl-carrier protein] reductase